MSNGSGGFRLVALWIFLTMAAIGLALILASLFVDTPRLLTSGSAVVATGALCFLAVQFWITGTRPVPASAPVPGRKIDFTFNDVAVAAPVPAAIPPPGAPRHHTAPKTFDEDLVEFQPAGPEAPTRLEVPPAFQVETQADAEPVKNRPWIEQTLTAGGGATEYVPAVERRQEIVSGLPLLSQIFSEPAAPKAEPATERPGKTRGQCGSCGTFLWAPTQRPIRLRCPKCGHVKTLTE